MTTSIPPVGDLTRQWSEPAPAVTPRLERMLAAQERALRGLDSSDAWGRSVVAQNIAKLERALDQSRRGDAAREKREAALAARQEEARAAAEERRQAAAEAEKAAIRTAFLASNPTATEHEFEAAWPALREDAQRARMTDHVARAAGAYRV